MTIKEQPFFSYDPLKSGQIRVMKLEACRPEEPLRFTLSHCPLQPLDDSLKIQFTAMSYVWGDLSASKRWIYLNNNPFYVQPNLFEALKAAQRLLDGRPHISRYLWADAVCINQQDIPERNAQVGEMGRIYRAATHVLAWLGQSTEDSDFACCFMYRFRKDLDKGIEHSFSKVETDAVTGICERDYWSRAWIQQEITVRWEGIMLMCGNYAFDIRYLRLVSSKMQALDWSALLQTQASFALQMHSANSLEYLICAPRSIPKCSDSRDRIFSLMGMASDKTSEWAADYEISHIWLFLGVFGVCKPSDPEWLAVSLVVYLDLSRVDLIREIPSALDSFHSDVRQRAREGRPVSIWRRQGLRYLKSLGKVEKIHQLANAAQSPSFGVTPRTLKLMNEHGYIKGSDVRPGDAVASLSFARIAVLFRLDSLGGYSIGFARKSYTTTRFWEQFSPDVGVDCLEVSLVEKCVRHSLTKPLTDEWVDLWKLSVVLCYMQKSVIWSVLQRLRMSGHLCVANLNKITRILPTGIFHVMRIELA